MAMPSALTFLLLGMLPPAPPPIQEPVPVLVELFTSEGCSSCPPADEVLGRLLKRPEPGVKVVALGFHVDYWDYIGWKDPFGSSAWSQRQRGYAIAGGGQSVYTPQLIVNGGRGFVGSDESSARAQLRAASASPRVPLALRQEGNVLRLSGTATQEPLDLWLAWTEEGLSSTVSRGENAGRVLPHASVVRSLQRLQSPSTEAWTLDLPPTPPEGTRGRPRTVVAFLQNPKTRAVRGIATISLGS